MDVDKQHVLLPPIPHPHQPLLGKAGGEWIHSAGVLPNGQSLKDAVKSTVLDPPNQWCDTTLIPTFGEVVMRQKFRASDIAWAGKTFFHCHFLDHEDQGMIAAIKIGPGPADHNAQMTNSYFGALTMSHTIIEAI